MGCLLASILPSFFLSSVLSSSFACTLGESVRRLPTASSQAISLIYTRAHADDKNRCSINYAWNYIPPPVPLLLITVSLLHYLFQKRQKKKEKLTGHISVHWKTVNPGSAATWDPQINGSVSSSRVKLFSLLAVPLSADSTPVCCGHVRHIFR